MEQSEDLKQCYEYYCNIIIPAQQQSWHSWLKLRINILQQEVSFSHTPAYDFPLGDQLI